MVDAKKLFLHFKVSKQALHNSKKLFVGHSSMHECRHMEWKQSAVLSSANELFESYLHFAQHCFYALQIHESNVKLIRREVSAIFCGLKI